MANINQDPKYTNIIRIAGVFGLQQISDKFTKQVLYIRAKDTKDNQWKNAEIEIYIKPDLIHQYGVNEDDTILIDGWLAFNFWNDRSFPRLVVNDLRVLEKAGAQPQQAQAGQTTAQPTNPQFNQPTPVDNAPEIPVGPAAPEVPEVPMMP